MPMQAESGIFGCRPVLSVANVARSLRYYGESLGFHIGLTWSEREARFLHPGEPIEPTFAILGLGQMQLMLAQNAQGAPGMWLHIDVESADHLDSLHAEWRERGAKIVEPPSIRPWGMYEMRVNDLDEHVFRVSSPPR